VAIRGGSAGGYTTLAALTFTTGAITVGASYFGVSDLSLLAKETHKLESRYMDQLIGTYPEAKAVYEARSPLAHVDQLNCPIIFFQGDEDKVVPANQSELMHKSLKKKGIASEYHLYAGEGHGFRRAENLQHCLKAEHAFYARFFGFAVQAQDAC
jgi:dipeptidyl aminopeptidase/acylaminoacyl peptidase